MIAQAAIPPEAIFSGIHLLKFFALHRISFAGRGQNKNPRRIRRGPCQNLVAHTGFEPVVSALRGRCPRPLDECAPQSSQVRDLRRDAKYNNGTLACQDKENRGNKAASLHELLRAQVGTRTQLLLPEGELAHDLHPGALVEARRSGQALGIDAEGDGALTARAEEAEGVLKQRERETTPPPRTTDGQAT